MEHDERWLAKISEEELRELARCGHGNDEGARKTLAKQIARRIGERERTVSETLDRIVRGEESPPVMERATRSGLLVGHPREMPARVMNRKAAERMQIFAAAWTQREALAMHGVGPPRSIAVAGRRGDGKSTVLRHVAILCGLPIVEVGLEGPGGEGTGRIQIAQVLRATVRAGNFVHLRIGTATSIEDSEAARCVWRLLEHIAMEPGGIIGIESDDPLVRNEGVDEVILLEPPDAEEVVAIVQLQLAGNAAPDDEWQELGEALKGITRREAARIGRTAIRRALLQGTQPISAKFVRAVAKGRKDTEAP